jgi:hypothetical protein
MALHGSSSEAQTAAKSRQVQLRWVVSADVPASDAVEIERGESVPFAKIEPLDRIRLGTAAYRADGTPLLTGETVLAWSSVGGRIACEPVRTTSRSFVCLEDADTDGRFESYALIGGIRRLNTEHMHVLMGYFPLGDVAPLGTQVPVPATDDQPFVPFDLEFTFLAQYGGGLLNPRVNNFALCTMADAGKNIWGRTNREKHCTPPVEFREKALPETHELPGGSATLISIRGAVATVNLDPPGAGYIF